MGTWTPGPGPTSGDDIFAGDDTDEIANGGDGNDTLHGGTGSDTLSGDSGDDRILPGDDFVADILSGGADRDILDYSNVAEDGITLDPFSVVRTTHALRDHISGFEEFIGTEANDVLTPGDGAVIRGGGGDDFILGENAQIWGGDGTDFFVVLGNTPNTIHDFEVGVDFFSNGVLVDLTEDGDDTILNFGGNAQYRIAGVTGLTLAAWQAHCTFDWAYDPWGVDDVFSLGVGAQFMSGGGGDDELHAGDGEDSLDGGVGADLLFGDGGEDRIFGGSGDDTISGGGDDDLIDGGTGVDSAAYSIASTGATWTRNTDGTWRVTAGADGVDTLIDIEVLSFSDRDLSFFDHPRRTFSGDGTSDILFRRADGIMASWEVTGTTINAASFLPTAAAEWTPLATGDVSGDGRDDVLWQRNDGLVYAWTMNGGAVSAAVGLAGLGPEWDFLGIGDFNGDLTDDLAWRRDDGVVFTWTMQNSAIQSANGVTGLGAAWQIAGFGDFNGDGRDDFLWRNESTGQSVIWHMNGSAIQGSGATSEQANLDWAVVGAGDTDGDGRDDIILQRASDGMIAVWAMDGTSVLSATDVAAANPAQWTIHNIGDYNGDGRDDILWQNDNGLVYVWLMNGASIQSAGALSGIGAEWGII